MRRFFIEISDQAFSNLADDAIRERRPVKEQAAWLLERAVLVDPPEPVRVGPEPRVKELSDVAP